MTRMRMDTYIRCPDVPVAKYRTQAAGLTDSPSADCTSHVPIYRDFLTGCVNRYSRPSSRQDWGRPYQWAAKGTEQLVWAGHSSHTSRSSFRVEYVQSLPRRGRDI